MPQPTFTEYATKRLAHLDGELGRLRSRIAEIEKEYEFLSDALNGKIPRRPYIQTSDRPETQPEAAKKIVCGSGHGWTTSDIAEAALRRFGLAIPDRSMNTVLNRLQKDGIVERRSDRKWHEVSTRRVGIKR